MTGSNLLLFDEPTNHLDLESIIALNNSLMRFKGTVIFTTQDRQLADTVSNRLIDILPNGKCMDRLEGFNEYLDEKREQLVAEKG